MAHGLTFGAAPLNGSPSRWLAETASRVPDAPALISPSGEVLDYRSFAGAVHGLAAELLRSGTDPGHALGAHALRPVEAAMLSQAAARLGCPIVPGDPLRPDHWRVALWLAAGVDRAIGADADLFAAADSTAAGALPEDRTEAESVLLIVGTSGSGGEPKGAMLTARNIAAAVQASRARLGLHAGDRWLICLPPHQVGALAVIYRCVESGATAVLRDGFDPERTWWDIVRLGITHVSLLPGMLAELLDAARDAPPPPALQRVVVGGVAIPAALAERTLCAGWPVCPSYGVTEAMAQIATALPEERAPAGCVGRPLAGFEVQVVDGHGRPTWGVGRIRVKGPAVMAGYADPERRGGYGLDEGWLMTGDLGRLDGGGRLWVERRADDVLVTGGENVHPRQVEEMLRGCPAIGEVAVAGRPDPARGAALVAVYTGDAPADAVEAWGRRHLPEALRPNAYHHVGSLPFARSGLIDRELLRMLAAGPAS
ncbi:MAG: acyl--CoA ligase [Gammaproteobacteria bacterium]|jgi:O-succinylbenzoic acid--CoA ligase|nr:acyl--CoA ligase [Gammaproteobacteria bacterium]